MLRELGADVIGYSLSPLTNPNMFSVCKLDKVVKTTINDISDYEKLLNYINDNPTDIVFHMAAQSILSEASEMHDCLCEHQDQVALFHSTRVSLLHVS